MDITITSENRKEYLFIESIGILQNKDELFEHATMLYREIAKYNAKKILIHQPGTHFPVQIFHYFDLVKSYINDFPSEIRTLKIAIVVAEEYKEIAASWESLSGSRGLQYFAFTSFEEAHNFLLK